MKGNRIILSIKALLLLITVMSLLPTAGMADTYPKLKEIAFGTFRGEVLILNLSDMTLKKMATTQMTKSHITGMAFFPSCNKIVFFVWLADKCYVREGCSHQVGIIDLNSGKVDYWDTSKIGLGTRILEGIQLSATDTNVVYGFFADRYDYEVPDNELEEYRKSIKTGVFDVCKNTWRQSPVPSEKGIKDFPGNIDNLPFLKKKSEIWQYLKADNLISDTEYYHIFWADDNYVLFTSDMASKKNVVLGHISAGHVIVDKIIDTKLFGDNGRILLKPDSAAFIYSE